MPRPPLSEAGYNAALVALPFVCLFVFLFNAYKLGKLNMKWYRDMSMEARYRFKRVVIVFIVGIFLIFAIGYSAWSHSFSIEKWKKDPENRTKIVEDFLRDYSLKGMPKSEVLRLLGNDNHEEGYFLQENRLVYYLGAERGLISIDSEWLVINFAEDIVSDYFITTD